MNCCMYFVEECMNLWPLALVTMFRWDFENPQIFLLIRYEGIFHGKSSPRESLIQYVTIVQKPHFMVTMWVLLGVFLFNVLMSQG
jgi:hypothetical protein